jgi:hypothetical protein
LASVWSGRWERNHQRGPYAVVERPVFKLADTFRPRTVTFTTSDSHGSAEKGRTPVGPLAFIEEKWEAPSEVLVNDGRQVGHDEEEDRD